MDNYKTFDTKLAAFLFAKGMPYKGADRINENGRYRFLLIFENKEQCNKLEIDYINGAEAPARKLFEAKDMLIDQVKKYYD